MSKHEYIGLLIGSARRRIRQAVTTRLRAYRLTSQQFWVLVRLFAEPGISLTELSERQRLDEPTASRVVTTLIRRKLVRTSAHPDDRRRLRLDLTPAGAKLGPPLTELATAVRAAIVDGMSREEQEALRAGLRHVIENMARFEQQAPPRRVRKTATPKR